MNDKTLTIPKKYEPKINETTVFIKDEKEYCIVNLEGFIYAIDNICPHKGASLGLGKLVGETVICPLHEYEFNVITGKCNIEKYKVDTYNVEFEED